MPSRSLARAASAVLLAGILLPTNPAPGASAPRYRLVDLGLAPGSGASAPARFAHDGSLLGWAEFTGPLSHHAVRWTIANDGQPAGIADLGGLQGYGWSSAAGGNASGWIVGTSNTANPEPRAVLWRGGDVLDIERGADGNANIYANDVNDAGQICGFMTKSGGGIGWEAVVWTEQATHPGRFDRTVLPLHASADTAFGWTEAQEILANGVVFGRQALNPGDRAALWLTDAARTPVLLEPLGFSNQSMPGDINEAGEAVGYTMEPFGMDRATRWANDAAHTPSELPRWPGYNSANATTIDPTGTIVLGVSSLVDPVPFPWVTLESRVVLWTDGAIWDVNQRLDASGAGWTVRSTHDVNASGWIAATAGAGAGDHAVLLIPVSDVTAVPPTPAAGIELVAPWPNPARGGVHVAFLLPQATDASVRVLDAQGRVVATPFAGPADAGRHEVTWDGRDAGGREAAPGLYFVTLDARGARASARLVRAH